jgi:hypothetical protein
MKNTRMELFLLIGDDDEEKLVSHETVRFEQMMKKT